MANIRPLEIVLAKKTIELVLLFYKKTTKLVFLLPNMGQLYFKVLNTTTSAKSLINKKKCVENYNFIASIHNIV